MLIKTFVATITESEYCGAIANSRALLKFPDIVNSIILWLN